MKKKSVTSDDGSCIVHSMQPTFYVVDKKPAHLCFVCGDYFHENIVGGVRKFTKIDKNKINEAPLVHKPDNLIE